LFFYTTLQHEESVDWISIAELWIILSYSVVSVLKRTIPTERPPLVGEVSANFCGYRVPRDQRDRSLRPYSRISRPRIILSVLQNCNFVVVMAYMRICFLKYNLGWEVYAGY
jgi:hypothetical protein